MLFANGTKGITLDRQALSLKVVDVVDGDWQAADVIVHEPTNKAIAHMLIDMPFGAFPMALGVIYDDPAPDLRKRGGRAERGDGRGQEPPTSRRWSPRARAGWSRRNRTTS